MNIRNGLVLTTAVAAALMVTGCSSPEQQAFNTDQPTAVCTDGSGNRVDDDLCDDNDGRGGHGGFMFLYLSSGSHVPAYGNKVHGGSKVKAPGTSYTPSKATPASRGGFGSSASSRGGSGYSSGS